MDLWALSFGIIRVSDPRSFVSLYIQGTHESLLRVEWIHQISDPRSFRSLYIKGTHDSLAQSGFTVWSWTTDRDPDDSKEMHPDIFNELGLTNNNARHFLACVAGVRSERGEETSARSDDLARSLFLRTRLFYPLSHPFWRLPCRLAIPRPFYKVKSNGQLIHLS